MAVIYTTALRLALPRGLDIIIMVSDKHKDIALSIPDGHFDYSSLIKYEQERESRQKALLKPECNYFGSTERQFKQKCCKKIHNQTPGRIY